MSEGELCEAFWYGWYCQGFGCCFCWIGDLSALDLPPLKIVRSRFTMLESDDLIEGMKRER